jgi:hypothetical protein
MIGNTFDIKLAGERVSRYVRTETKVDVRALLTVAPVVFAVAEVLGEKPI